MWWLLAFIACFAVIMALVIKVDGLAKEHKRLLVQARLRDNESFQVQQLAVQLAQQYQELLLQQLNAARRLTRIPEAELRFIELICQAIPGINKELSRRQMPLVQAFRRYLQTQPEVDVAALEAFINQHGRLIPFWLKNNFEAYLQLAATAVQMVRDNSHKDFRAPVTAANSQSARVTEEML